MIKTSIFLLHLIMMISCACNRTSPEPPVSHNTVNDLPVTDTLLNTRLSGRPIELRFDKKLLGEVQQTLVVANRYRAKPLTLMRRGAEDLTGDGREEQVQVVVSSTAGRFYVSNRISVNGKVAWQDTLWLDDGLVAEKLWEGNPVYHQLKPYATFKAATEYMDFILDANTADFATNKVTQQLVTHHFRSRGLQGEQLAKAMRNFHNYLNNYRGKYVFSLSLAEPGIYLWYQPERKYLRVQ